MSSDRFELLCRLTLLQQSGGTLMSLTICNIHFSQQPEQVVYASKSLIQELQLNTSKPLIIRLGQKEIKALIKPLKRTGKHLYLSSGIREIIKVPSSGTIHLFPRDTNDIQLGPLIGILTDVIKPGEGSPFNSRSSFVKQVIKAGHNKAYTFGFTPADINWQNKTIHGYFLNAQGTWFRREVAFPDVIYNRLPNRKTEIGPSMTALRERFVKIGIPFFNWSFLNKADVYEFLDNDPEALLHLPESVTNPSQEKMKSMLHQYKFIYFKPGTGSLGHGIYRITYHQQNGYFVRYRNNGANTLLKFTSFEKMYRTLSLKHGEGLKNYVAQQGIRLIELDKCPVDFRFHMHKDINNEWQPVGIGAKKAGRGSVTTHMKSGGTLLTPQQALQYSFGNRTHEILEKAKNVSIKISEAIERNYTHRLGELGLDIGIDQNGDVWMFEANAKPGRSIFKHPELRIAGRESLNHIVEHCLYLSQFQGGGVS